MLELRQQDAPYFVVVIIKPFFLKLMYHQSDSKHLQE